MSQIIYIADDEKNIRDLIEAFLTKEGYQVAAYADGDSLLEACRKSLPSLVILDVMMPGTDGFSTCSLLRKLDDNLPIIIVSAKDNPYDRVTGLTLGSDDYLVKPFLPLELVARVKALLRRTTPKNEIENTSNTLTFGDIEIDPSYHCVYHSGSEISFTPTEFDFMAYLIAHAERAVSREELLKVLWQVNWQQADTRATDDLVKRLRKKLRELNSCVAIETVWGYGFRLSIKKEE